MSDSTIEGLAHIVEFGEGYAVANLQQGLPAALKEQFGTEVRRIGGAMALVAARLPLSLFNRVIGLGIAAPATEAMVDEIAALYRGAGVKGMVQLSPAAPPQLAGWLEARGFRRGDGWAKFYRPPTPPPSITTSLRVAPIGPEHAAAFAQIVCTAFEMPPELGPLVSAHIGQAGWHDYLAFDDDQPVAVGTMYLQDGIASLLIGATLPSHRGRGGQGAIMARRIADALALGCRWLTTETDDETADHPNPSYHNMVRTGFQLAYVRPNYMLMV